MEWHVFCLLHTLMAQYVYLLISDFLRQLLLGLLYQSIVLFYLLLRHFVYASATNRTVYARLHILLQTMDVDEVATVQWLVVSG